MSESWRSACSWAVPILLKGSTGARFCSALYISKAAIVARYFDDVCGIAVFNGKNSIISTILSPLVFLM
jgi:hypothetical protein